MITKSGEYCAGKQVIYEGADYTGWVFGYQITPRFPHPSRGTQSDQRLPLCMPIPSAQHVTQWVYATVELKSSVLVEIDSKVFRLVHAVFLWRR